MLNSGEDESYDERCLTCQLNRDETSAPGGAVYRDALWSLEHAIEPIPMVGWLVLKPVRHVEAFADLTLDEAVLFGSLTRRTTQAMTTVLQPTKIYLSMYMEAEGFAHLHVHIIPRFVNTPPDRRGPRVFDYLRECKQSGRNLGDPDAAREVVVAIRHLLQAPVGN